MSHNENDYFLSKDRDLLAHTKREKEREELKKQEIAQIAEILNTTPELALQVYELGFDAEAARILHLVPVIQVAWADNSIGSEERKQLLELAEMRGVSSEEGGPGWTFFELITSRKPADHFFEEANRVISNLVHDGNENSARSILDNCKQVAEASRGFLGLRKIDKDEEALLQKFAHLFADK